ncbi:MAG: glycosyltransferase family 4 protein [Deltaproteobacteria bacterium]|nr:glycosyltransferase family 4 protein [Deltaproteobacteria bacterium]
MNILQVINVRWFNAEAAYAYSLAKGLIKKGHKVIVLGLPKSPVIEKAKADRIQVYETTSLNSYNPFLAMAGLRSLARLMDLEDIEVINCHRSEGYPVIALAAMISKRQPRLVRTRGDVREVKKWPLNRIFYTRFADGVIASGEVIKKGLIERLGLPEEMVDIVYAAVDTERFRPLNTYKDIRKELGVPSDSPLIAILGRLGEVKGHRYFIEAASLILNEHPSARFLIVAKEMGEGAERLKRNIAGAGLDGKVLFTGFREDLLEVMASCDIGVVSSIGSEANCRVVLEWMAMGKPVVATTVGVIPEVLRDGETGYLVPPKDSLAISKAVNMLLSDREKAISFGNKGRKLVESVYNEELFVENTLEVYRKALKHS